MKNKSNKVNPPKEEIKERKCADCIHYGYLGDVENSPQFGCKLWDASCLRTKIYWKHF